MLSGRATADRLDGIVHAETQLFDVGVDLTVATVAVLEAPGSLDFGGSEFEEAQARILEPELRDPNDEYGWWDLEEGTYRVRFNERPALGPGEIGWVSPHPRLLLAGASHPTFSIAAGDELPPATLLAVGPAGCRLKENCRISRLFVAGVQDPRGPD